MFAYFQQIYKFENMRAIIGFMGYLLRETEY